MSPVPERLKAVVMEEDVLLGWEIDFGRNLVGLLGPAAEIDVSRATPTAPLR